MLTFDNFKNLFHRAKKTQWILYKGNGKGQQIGSMLSDEEISVEDSLNELQDIVSSYGDGVYTVECRSSRTASRGNDMHTFMYGDGGESAKSVGKSGATTPVHPMQSFFSGLDAKYFIDQGNTLNQQIMNLQMQVLKKDMEIMNLKRDLKETEKSDEASIGNFMAKNPDLVGRVIDMFAPGTAGRTAVGSLKTTKPIPPVQPAQQEQNTDQDEEEEYEYEPGKIDLNALFEAAVRLQAAIPDFHPNDVFDKIADYAEDKPDQATNLLKML